MVGDLDGNAARIEQAIAAGRRAGADLVVTPELSLCGYPPEDLVLRPAFLDACARSLDALVPASTGLDRAGRVSRGRRRQALQRGRRAARRPQGRGVSQADAAELHGLRRAALFRPRRERLRGRRGRRSRRRRHLRGPVVCGPARAWRATPARRCSSSPTGRPTTRTSRRCVATSSPTRARETGLPIVYVNRVGGQDELVFDGASFVVDAGGTLVQQLPAWRETIALAEFDGAVPKPVRGELDARLEPHVYEALTMGVRDYVEQERLSRACCSGLSGGIDSALTLAVAVDALGRERVRARDAAFGVQRRDQPRGRAHDGGHPRRALRRDPDRRMLRRVQARARARSSRACPRTPPRRTSRHASAARC